MAEEYIEITHKNKSGEVKTIKYRVDPDFVPKKLADICEDFIQNYCIAKDEINWLDKQYASKETFTVKKDKRTYKGVVYEKGEEYEADKTFISIRKDFAEKFFGIKKSDDANSKNGRAKWEEKKKKLKAKK